MTPDQARKVAEHVDTAKDALLDALRIAESSGSARLARQIGNLCGRAETLQRKAAEKLQSRGL